jgi:hypothetical protein
MVTGISLFVMACISGTLHGVPHDACREFQIRHYDTAAACYRAPRKAVDEWLNGLRRIGIEPRVPGYRCGPTEKEDEDI